MMMRNIMPSTTMDIRYPYVKENGLGMYSGLYVVLAALPSHQHRLLVGV